MPLPFAPIFVGLQLVLVAAPVDLPNVDIRKTCEAASGVMAELMTGGTAQHDLDVCLSSEQTAREQIIKDWARYSSAEKRQCVQPSVYLPSYIEWPTCLEMEMSVRKPNSAAPNSASPNRASANASSP
jgi:hypothetical protein